MSDARTELKAKSRRSFLWAAGALVGVFAGWRWLIGQDMDKRLPWPFRRAHEFNEALWSVAFRRHQLSPEFPRSMAKMPRPNGSIGLKSELDIDQYRLFLESPGGRTEVALSEVLSMPKTDVVTELRCIEGWSEIVHFSGVRLSTFLEHASGSGYDLFDYLYAETPDREYFVGLDMDSVRHPQALLCWEMDGKALEPIHGAPLRLFLPTKYGIKSLKRVGLVRLTNERPSDYWYERGYDWYAGQ